MCSGSHGAVPVTDVVIYEKDACHLCEAVEAEIRSMETADVTVIDIESDPALLGRYLVRVPVVTTAGREVFEAKMMDRQGRWKAVLRSLLAER